MSEVPGAGGPSPEGVVTLHHEAAEGSVVAPAQRGCCLGCAPDLPHDMPRPPEALLAHQLAASWGGKGSAGPPPTSSGPLQMCGTGRQGSGPGGWGASGRRPGSDKAVGRTLDW